MVLCGVSPMNSLCSSGMNDTVDEGFLLYRMHVRKGQLKHGLVPSMINQVNYTDISYFLTLQVLPQITV